ncbi:MAG: hypothetical protein FWE31_00560 [Firmicutes bacterium]|nr:hypothetical protein [Bacillota bacterium]
MSGTLLKSLLKKNAVLYWCFMAVIMVYFSLVIFMYPLIVDMMTGETGGGIFGDMFDVGDIGVYTATMLGELLWSFGLVLFIMLVFRLIFRPVDSGSLSMHLMSGISRTKYMLTALTFLAIKLTTLFILLLSVGLLSFVALGESFNFGHFFSTTLMATISLSAVVFISYLLGSVFAGSKWAAGLLIAVPVCFFLFISLSHIHSSLEFFRWITPFGWFLPSEMAIGDFSLWWIVLLAYITIIALTSIVSIFVFKRKNLSL